MAKPKDIAGQRFGRLVALEITERRTAHGCAYWVCICDCGARKEIGLPSLMNGNTQSCGCYHKQQARKSNLARIGRDNVEKFFEQRDRAAEYDEHDEDY